MSRPRKPPEPRLSKTGKERKRRAGRTVYIGLRHYNPEIRLAENCNGLNIRAFDFTPQEVHDIIRRALSDAAREYQALERARKLMIGDNPNDPEKELPALPARCDVQNGND